MLQMPGVSLACADFVLAAMCRWQERNSCHKSHLYFISNYHRLVSTVMCITNTVRSSHGRLDESADNLCILNESGGSILNRLIKRPDSVTFLYELVWVLSRASQSVEMFQCERLHFDLL